jgi:hypothetical protein
VSQYWKSLIYFGKGEQISEIVNVWKKYTELIVTRASGSIPVDFLCQNGFGVKVDCSKTGAGGNNNPWNTQQPTLKELLIFAPLNKGRNNLVLYCNFMEDES